jgi:hypothetical protein
MTPVYKLDVTGGNGNAIRFTDSVNSVQVAMGAFNSQGFFGTLSNHPQLFYVNSGEGMRLTSTGLGIGTSSPSASFKLDVTGLIRSNATANGGGQVTIAKSGTTVGVLCGSGNVIGSAATDLALYAETGNSVSIFTNGSATARATFDTSGNLLLGVTSSTGLTGTGDFAMPNNRAIRFRNAANSAYLNMIYVDTSNNLNFGFGGVPPNITFGINGIGEVSRFDSSGNFLVGTTSAVPGSPTRGNFYNAGSASAVVGIQNARNVSGDVVNAWFIGSNANNTSSYFLQCGVSGVANVLYIYGNGNVQNTNNSYGGISDVKLKENIVDASPKLADLMQVKVRNYNLIGSTTKQIGVVAQELEAIFPAMVDESPDRDEDNNVLETTTKSVKYSVFVPMLIKAIQELKAEFDAYKSTHP